jgi:PPOX class probable F420-dependent enzyme
MGVRMSREEASARIAAAHTGIVTTLRRDGMPISTPMWFCVVDGDVYFGTPAGSKKVARLRRDPKVAFLVEGGKRWAELWAVHLTGRAVRVDDPATIARVTSAHADKYARFATPRSRMPEATRRHYEASPRVIFRIDADERILSWDNAKLGLA